MDKLNSLLVIEKFECLRLASDGAGVGYAGGLATFVSGLLPGEVATIKVIERKKTWQRAEILKLEAASPQRIVPPCSIYDICGGCQLQHMAYEETLLWKRRWVEDALHRIGKIEVEGKVRPTLGMAYPWRYRNKARLHCRNGEMGYYQGKSNSIIEFTDCLLLSEHMNRWIAQIRESLHNGRPEPETVTFRENQHGEGMLLRETAVGEVKSGNSPAGDRKTGDLQVGDGEEENLRIGDRDAENLRIRNLAESGLSEIRKLVDARHAETAITSIWQSDSAGKLKALLGGPLNANILGLDFQVSPLTFLQVNFTQMDVLYSLVLEYAELTGTETVWDLYSGIGTLTLALAGQAGEVWGIEENPYSVADAWENAKRNGIANVRFSAGKVEELCAEWQKAPDLVVLDPPRAGADKKVLEQFLRLRPERIIYVSCDPGTLARDVGRLAAEGGYVVDKVQPVDMFGWTGHVETVAILSATEQIRCRCLACV